MLCSVVVDGALRDLTSALCWVQDQVSGPHRHSTEAAGTSLGNTLMNRQTFLGRKHKFADVEQLGDIKIYSMGNKLS